MSSGHSLVSNRRRILQGMGALALAPVFGAAREQDVPLFVGTYSSDKGRGLYPLLYRPASDEWSLNAPVEAIENASFGAYSRRFGLHYLLDEQDEGRVGVYRARGADWTRVDDVATMGSGPCYVTLDKAERCMVVANYNSGSIAFYRLDPASGLPLEPVVRQDSGHGPNVDRQAGPHAHWAGFSPDQRFLYSIDLGTDQVLAYAFDARQSEIGEAVVGFRAPPGTGPRHMVFHPRLPLVYLASELANSLTALHRLSDGRLQPVQALSTLPADFKGHNQAAHIAINRAGTRLYVSNRGHNSIAVFTLGRAGRAKLVQHVPTLGDWPRFFLFIEEHRRLIVANERSGELVVFRVAPDGSLQATQTRLRVPEAVYVGRVN
ncbi:MAG: lactonase family protein [Rhizomicrobium sp.]|jgi:6-phosphogluconolactonase